MEPSELHAGTGMPSQLSTSNMGSLDAEHEGWITIAFHMCLDRDSSECWFETGWKLYRL